MVTPVNNEKIAALIPERTQARKDPADGQQTVMDKNTASAGATEKAADPDMSSARQMYELESSRLQSSGSAIDTPEQARALVDQLMQQFSAAPETALKAQGNGSGQFLDKLLTAAPA